MTVEVGSVNHISQVISQVVGPSFLLGAVASFISMLFTRMTLVTDRLRDIHELAAKDRENAALQQDIQVLRWRIRLMHQSILLAIGSGVATTILIVSAFALAILQWEHVWGAAALFMLALAFFCGSLVLLARDVIVSAKEYDRY